MDATHWGLLSLHALQPATITMSIKLSPPRLFVSDKDERLLDQMRQIHADCILQDGQLATFLPPLNRHRMRQYWKDKCEQVQRGEIAIIIQLEATTDEDPRIAGYVCLGMPFAETGPFRGIVINFFVSTKFRKMGVGRALMTKLEEVAREKGRYLLVSRR